jgi:hypothetical protein
MGKIIGISGKAGVGKDYLADLIVNKYQHYYKIGFADDLKVIGADLGMFNVKDAYTQEGKQKIIPWLGITIREFLQKFGTDAMRNGVHRDFWVKRLIASIKPDDHVVITDMRFKNEFEAVEDRVDGYTIRINRRLPFKEWCGLTGLGDVDIPTPSGPIEKGVFCDFMVANTGALTLRQKKVIVSMTHKSETDLDNVEHDMTINHKSDLDHWFWELELKHIL